jgi:hypothetical protein
MSYNISLLQLFESPRCLKKEKVLIMILKN